MTGIKTIDNLTIAVTEDGREDLVSRITELEAENARLRLAKEETND